MSGSPERIAFHNGKVWSKGRYFQAVAIRQGLIETIGSNERVKALLDKSTVLVNLEGATVLPGFVDSHVHLDWLSLEKKWADLKGTTSAEEAVSRLAPLASRIPPGSWLLGRGWDSNMWLHKPNIEALDSIRKDILIALVSKDGHSLWVNTLAFEKGKFLLRDREKPGFIIEKKKGKPTGVLKENAVDSVLSLALKEIFVDEKSIRETLLDLARLGLVGVHDFSQRNVLGLLSSLEGKGKLPLRVCSFLPLNTLPSLKSLGIVSGFGAHFLRIMGIKIFIDGSLTSRTALMIKPYEGLRKEFGVLALSKKEIIEAMRTTFLSGLSVSAHAIGDMANRIALDSYEKVKHEFGKALRSLFRIEHAQLLHPSDIPRFGKLGVFASMQPIHAISDMEKADLLWGKRVKYSYAWNSLIRSGAKLVFGSDAPVESPDPLLGVHAAVTRRKEGKESWVKEECITPREALTAYTLNPAALEGLADLRGSIEEGKFADLVILSRDILREDPSLVPSAQVLGTLSSGKASFTSSFLKGRLP